MRVESGKRTARRPARRIPAKIILIAVLFSPLESFAESLTMTTWYPAPVGVYQSLITTGGAQKGLS